MSNSAPTLNIIGCGRLAKTLARLWHQHNLLVINQVLNRTPASGEAAVAFIGAGTAPAGIDQLSEADFWLIATDDATIAPVAETLARSHVLRPGDIVFHCSGALASDILSPLREQDVRVASAHPLHAFSDPLSSVASFAGSFCALEGVPAAVERLTTIFQQIGGRPISIAPENKVLYHTASVMASNFLVVLLDASLKTFAAAGIDQAQAKEILRPITHSMIDAVLDADPAAALTGPIARGDVTIIEKQLNALAERVPALMGVYREMGLHNIEIAKIKGQANPENLSKLKSQFENPKPV